MQMVSRDIFENFDYTKEVENRKVAVEKWKIEY